MIITLRPLVAPSLRSGATVQSLRVINFVDTWVLKFNLYLLPYFPKFLPIIPFPQHHQLFLFYSIVPTIVITISECFNRMFDCSIRVLRSFANYVERHSMNLGGSGPRQVPFGYTTVVSRVSNVSAIAVSCLMLVHSLKFWNFSFQYCGLVFLKLSLYI